MKKTTDYNHGDDNKNLRKILGQFATGVAIVTTFSQDNRPCGITINSLTSVSLEPPLLLFCLSKFSGTMAAFQTNPNFAINILDGEQKAISKDFSRQNFDKFANIKWEIGEHKCPILPDNIATIECKKTNEFDGGDHIIILGEIMKASGHASHDPLIYHGGEYKKIHI